MGIFLEADKADELEADEEDDDDDDDNVEEEEAFDAVEPEPKAEDTGAREIGGRFIVTVHELEFSKFCFAFGGLAVWAILIHCVS